MPAVSGTQHKEYQIGPSMSCSPCHCALSLNKDLSFLTLPITLAPLHSGSLVRFGDFCISLLGNHVLACTSLWGCKVGNIFAKIYSFMTNGSDPLKIWVSFHLLTFAHLGWCLWCEGEGLSHSEVQEKTEKSAKGISKCYHKVDIEVCYCFKIQWELGAFHKWDHFSSASASFPDHREISQSIQGNNAIWQVL